MLPNSHLSTYSAFRQQIQGITTEQDRIALKAAMQSLHQMFQIQVKSLSLEEMAPTLEGRVRSLWVEIDKQLRLLDMDVAFLRTARHPEKIDQRMSQMRDRLATLTQYCNILLGEE